MLLFFCLSAWRWKGLYLYLGGRVLIKSVMNTIPTYMMSLFPIPKIVERKINPLAKIKWVWVKNLSLHIACPSQKWLWRRFIAEKYGLLNHWTTVCWKPSQGYGLSLIPTCPSNWEIVCKKISGMNTGKGEDSLKALSQIYISYAYKEMSLSLRCGPHKDGTKSPEGL